ncbi:cupin domain-containing protein [Desulfovibrio sp. OttesenSCG-928-A18]|nr:cupin domain-containing protein [Desulfovibrio sp. OttesenSCG-928-A18]
MHYTLSKSMPLALLLLMAVLAGLAHAAESDGQITVWRRGEQPSIQGSAQNYTGSVRVDEQWKTEAPARLAGETLTFEPSARTAWHDNPGGQSVIITSGRGYFQEENGPIEIASAGDVVTFPPKVRHWFGAAPNTGMSAMVVATAIDGKSVNWREKVTDAQYATAAPGNFGGKQSRHLAINRSGSLASGKANPKNFTGEARVDSLFSATKESDTYGAYVTFEPCSRTDWHSHPMGQTLIVTSGRGYVQRQGGPLHEIRQGDIAWTPADVVHWHGAAPETAMTHLALSERVQGKAVTWGANVTDKEYGAVNPNIMPVRYQKIALISAFTANGDADRLKGVLVEALEAGLTVNEVKEVLIHTYAYAGFPRALNGINTFIAVMDEREKQGIKDVVGPEARTVTTDKNKYEYGHDTLAKLRDPSFQPGPAGSLKLPAQRPRYETFAPTIEVFLKGHLFADIFIRDVLDYRSREIATVGVLFNLPGANAQFRSHTGLAMTQGFSENQMKDLFTVMGSYLGRERGDNALMVLQQAVDAQKK